MAFVERVLCKSWKAFHGTHLKVREDNCNNVWSTDQRLTDWHSDGEVNVGKFKTNKGIGIFESVCHDFD